jgi:lipoprotein-anchoring transpeptidase ErfK/SrfK
MKFPPFAAVAFLLPLSPASAQSWLPGTDIHPGTPRSGVVPVQYGGYYEPSPQQLREFIDQDGNRIFLNEYGEVVSIVPPSGQEGDWGQRGGRDWGMRAPARQGVPEEYILEGPVDPYDRYGGYDRRPVEPNYNDYRSYPPPPSSSGVERAPLGQPDFGPNPTEGPRPYTPPSASTPQQADEPALMPNRGKAEVAALQILLDRAGISPGVIDGQIGSNVRKALEAYEMKTGRALDANDTDAVMEELRNNGGLPITQYTITPEDAAGPFIAAVPTDYSEKAALDAMSYTSVAEKLAERFHMDEAYLRAINPNADFTRPGTVIKVASVGQPINGRKVTRIVADKQRKQVFAYDEAGELVAAYPATIGSRATPSPTGTHTVQRIALDPEYTYNPKINFQQGDNDRVLRIPPGPNGPVGSVWIALSKPTYGIHGTPEPSAIGKTESNGCIRLTNWDARELAKLVEPGVTVEFVEALDEMVVSETEETVEQVIQFQPQLQPQ